MQTSCCSLPGPTDRRSWLFEKKQIVCAPYSYLLLLFLCSYLVIENFNTRMLMRQLWFDQIVNRYNAHQAAAAAVRLIQDCSGCMSATRLQGCSRCMPATGLQGLYVCYKTAGAVWLLQDCTGCMAVCKTAGAVCKAAMAVRLLQGCNCCMNVTKLLRRLPG